MNIIQKQTLRSAIFAAFAPLHELISLEEQV
jgi:hypothetical protein